MKDKFRFRHKILETLQENLLSGDRPGSVQSEDIQLSLFELGKQSGLREDIISAHVDYLNEAEEISINYDQNECYYMIIRKGTIAFYDKKYLDAGFRKFWNDAYDVVKTISTIILLLIAAVSFVINITETKKNKTEIERLKAVIQQMHDSSTVKKTDKK